MSYSNYFDDEEQELITQLDTNNMQMRDLLVMSRTDAMNLLAYAMGLIILTSILAILLMSFLFSNIDRLPFVLRSEIIDNSGSISIFIILGIIKLAQAMYETWHRRSEINFLIHQQELSISYGRKVLEEAKDR